MSHHLTPENPEIRGQSLNESGHLYHTLNCQVVSFLGDVLALQLPTVWVAL